MRILFLVSLVVFFPLGSIKSTPNLREYKTDTIVLRTDLPSEFSELFIEYVSGFSSLVIDFWSESNKENFKIDLQLMIFRSCSEFTLFKNEKSLQGSPIYFSIQEKKSPSEFTLVGCFTNTKFFFRAFQNKFLEAMLSDKKKFPIWLQYGMIDYFENSYFIADDFSITPFAKNEYILRLKQKKYISNGNGENLKKLLVSTKKAWKDNSKEYYPYSWAFFRYLMDVHPKGRSILMKYIENIRYSNNKIDLLKTYDSVFGFMGSSEPVSILELEREFHLYLNSLEEPKGYSKFRELSGFTVTESRLRVLYSALDMNRTFSLFHDTISEEYFNSGEYLKALEYAESAIELDLRSKKSIKKAISSSFRLSEFHKTEYYLWLASQIRMNMDEFKEIQKKVNTWRQENQDSIYFQPEVRFINFE